MFKDNYMLIAKVIIIFIFLIIWLSLSYFSIDFIELLISFLIFSYFFYLYISSQTIGNGGTIYFILTIIFYSALLYIIYINQYLTTATGPWYISLLIGSILMLIVSMFIHKYEFMMIYGIFLIGFMLYNYENIIIKILISFIAFIYFFYSYNINNSNLNFGLSILTYIILIIVAYKNNYIINNAWLLVLAIASVFALVMFMMFNKYKSINISIIIIIGFVLFMNYIFKFFIGLGTPDSATNPYTYIKYTLIYGSLLGIFGGIVYKLYKILKDDEDALDFILDPINKVIDYIWSIWVYLKVEYDTTDIYDLIITFICFIILIILLFHKQLYHLFIHLNDGKYLIYNPITLSEETTLQYTPEFKYRYAISGWFWFNSVHSPNDNIPILNYGDCPIIEFNPETSKINVVFLTEDNKKVGILSSKVLLQKWNNIVINYTGNTVDVFINGTLIKTINNIIPINSSKNITVGSQNGISGGISNLMYFSKPLTIYQINEIYSYTPKY